MSKCLFGAVFDEAKVRMHTFRHKSRDFKKPRIEASTLK